MEASLTRPLAKARGREPAWLKVARRWMPAAMKTGDLYDALGWTQGGAYWRRRSEDVKLSLLVRVSHIVGAPLGLYLEDVVRELWRRTSGSKIRRLVPRVEPPRGTDPLTAAMSDFKTRVRRAKAKE